MEPERYLPMNREELIADNERLRAKLLEVAESCAECDGTGLVTRTIDSHDIVAAVDADDQPCPDCHDIRELLE